jgi:UDP-N-acetylmuramoylalanine-D-glutamate ligase
LLRVANKKVWACGNIRNSVNLPILEKIEDGDFLLAELDSWLLQGFADLKISPDFAIFTNFFRDHQNYYHSMKKYFLDKAAIFRFQEKGHFVIFTNQSMEAYKKYFGKKIKSRKIIARLKKLPK